MAVAEEETTNTMRKARGRAGSRGGGGRGTPSAVEARRTAPRVEATNQTRSREEQQRNGEQHVVEGAARRKQESSDRSTRA